MYLQLWALGRAADAGVLSRDGLPYLSSSATPLKASGSLGEDNDTTASIPVPWELSKEEIQRYKEWYVQAAKTTVFKAGFDGVEDHSANGYLLDQFLQNTCNQRTDEYGGSIENRARFTLEVTSAVVAAVGAKKTGIRFSPWGRFNDMRMDDPIPTFSYVVKELAK